VVKENAEVGYAACEAGCRWVYETRSFCVDTCEVEYGTALKKDIEEKMSQLHGRYIELKHASRM
jgi:hypothetical protein